MRQFRQAILLAALMAGAPAYAQAAKFNPRAPENTQVLPNFSLAGIEPVLAQIGARYQRAGAAAGARGPSLLVTFPNGRKAVVVLSSCASDGCKALTIQSYWTPIANSPKAAVSAAIDNFGRRYAYAKVFIAADGRPALQRYLTADYGFVRGNLAVNFLVFSDMAEKFANEVLRPLESPGK